MIQFHNTLSGKIEPFVPIKWDEIGIYTCGPTVYDDAHIGNLRAYVFSDILHRTLENNGFKIKHVINITDVGHLISDADEGEDKMSKGLRREELPLTLEGMKTLADKYTGRFLSDISDLNIKTPTVLPKASEHIAEDIELIKKLEEKGYAYKTSDGMYFDTSKFSGYGKLGNINISGLTVGARVTPNAEKRNPTDFALWKFNSELGWDTPWGKGFPGWHIECSAMSVKYLGQPFDIHTGGIDHIPVHHQNEIAQSESATDGTPLANYWLHSEHLTMSGDKMAKSSGGFIRLSDLKEKGIPPLAFRYYLLTAHYETRLDWSEEALLGASEAYSRLINQISNMAGGGNISSEYQTRFKDIIDDNLNTPKAIALMWEVVKDKKVSEADRRATILEFDKVLGLDFENQINTKNSVVTEIPEQIQTLIKKRESARNEQDFKKADEIREEIKKLGFDISDTNSGVVAKKV